jgi:hypothetical protein
MNRKKLLALGCAVGILAFGACFTPPPRIRVNLHGAHRIVVRVTNTSETRHIDPAMLSKCIADLVNLCIEGHAKAVADGEIRPGDAILDIAILKEDAVEQTARKPRDSTLWRISLTLATNLRRSDGSVLWTEPNHTYSTWTGTDRGTEAWNAPGLANGISGGVCDKVAERMLYGYK